MTNSKQVNWAKVKHILDCYSHTSTEPKLSCTLEPQVFKPKLYDVSLYHKWIYRAFIWSYKTQVSSCIAFGQTHFEQQISICCQSSLWIKDVIMMKYHNIIKHWNWLMHTIHSLHLVDRIRNMIQQEQHEHKYLCMSKCRSHSHISTIWYVTLLYKD